MSFDQHMGRSHFVSDNRILKLDREGNELWAIPTPLVGYPAFGDIGIDSMGNVYVSGRFTNTVAFGQTNLTSAGEADVLLVKYDPEGQLVWARQAGGATNETSDRIAVSPAGDCYVSGSFRSTTTFGTFTLSNTSAFSSRFVAKYDSQGSVIWAKQYFGERELFYTVAAGDSAGNGFVITETGSTNFLIAKFDPQGATLWSKTLQYSNNSPIIPRVRADAAGNYYLVGAFFAPNLILDEHTLTNTSSGDAFVAKLETTTPPPLLIERLADSARLSWSILAENFHLESTGALSDSTAWTNNALTPEVLGLSNVVALPITSEPMFFRLKRP